jgi:hypothetical protein
MAALLISTFLNAEQVVPLADFTEEDFTAFSEGNLPNVVIKCKKGTYLPFSVNVSGDFFSYEGEALSPLKIIKTLYVKCPESDEFLFSSDLVAWKPFSEFFTGQIQATVKIEEGRPIAGLDLEINAR